MNYQRYLRDRQQANQAPLTEEQLLRFAPSIFAGDRHQVTTSDKYQFIPTANLVTALRDEGFVPIRAAQTRVRLADRRDHTRHMVVFRQPGQASLLRVGDVTPEVVLFNSHDGSSSYQLHAGIFRMICSNGLIVADGMLHSVRIPHKGPEIVSDVIEGTYRVIQDLPEVLGYIEGWRETEVTRDQQVAYAKAALELRWDAEEAPVSASQLISPKRNADAPKNLWNTFNTVQENIINGGLPGQTKKGSRTTTRAVNSINENLRINKALWTLTEEMAKLVK